MATGWITAAAKEYGDHLVQKRRADDNRRRLQEVERARQNRIAQEGPAVGANLWAGLQAVIKGEVDDFNQALGYTVMQTKALGGGIFEVHLSEPDGAEKIAAITYDSDKTALSWHIFGGVNGAPLTVGLEPGEPNLQFVNGQTYYKIESISQQILSTLLP